VCAALLLAGCGGAGGPTDGGKDTLPGALPNGVTFTAADLGAAAPPFALKLLDGTRVDSAGLWRERPVVLFFFASWCSRCADQQHKLEPLVERYRDVVTFVGLAGQDKPAAVRSWLSEHDVTYPVGIDDGLAIWKPYAVRTPPAVVLIGKGGKLLRGWTTVVQTDVLEDELSQLVRR
jgi:cytochrome c biogenesis protein CcmG/thiol:disulfide interchange protein DsbE